MSAHFSSSKSHRPSPMIQSSRIVVLAGGDSAEREVSLQSGACVAQALGNARYHVVELDPKFVDLQSYHWLENDIAFIALHGRFGEDGQVQSMLEKLGVRYTGSDASASRIGISKSASKERFLQFGIPTKPYTLIHGHDSAERILKLASGLGYPLVLKPDTQGSSIGVSMVCGPDELLNALPTCFRFDDYAILEKAIVGIEWTVGVLDDFLFPPIRISTTHGFFDYDAKYLANDTDYQFEFDRFPEVIQRVKDAGKGACRAIGTRGIARVDLIVDEDLNPWVLEVNTIPGFTDHSLVPKAAAYIGWSFLDLCERAVASALKGFSADQPRESVKPNQLSARDFAE